MARLLARLVARASALTVLTYFLAMVITVVLLASTSIGQDLLSHQGTLVLGAFLIPLYTPLRINLLGGFLVLFGIYILCFSAALKSRGGYIPSLKSLLDGSNRRALPNWLVVMPVAASGLLLVVVAVTLIQNALGVSTGMLPNLEPYQFLYTLAYAPPLEETMFRISTLGLPVAFRVLWSNNLTSMVGASLPPDPKQARFLKPGSIARRIVLSFLFPDKAKSEAALSTIEDSGLRGLHWTEWLALALTSVGFGLAHLLSNVGWEAGKVVTATLAGFALGLVYLSYGAYASILLHWFFNVYFEVYSLGSSLIGGVFDIFEVSVTLLTIAVGALAIISAIVWVVRRPRKGGLTPYIVPPTFPPS